MKQLIALFLMLTVSGLVSANPTIDATSEDSFNASVEEIRKALSDEEREEFDSAATSLLMFSMMEGRTFIEIGGMSEEQLDFVLQEARSGLDGKSAEEVIAIANRSQDESSPPPSEEGDIASNNILEKFKIESTNFFFRDSGYIKSPVIEMTVTNNTGQAVSQGSFRGTLITPGRSVPWLNETFTYSIPGGIEPGETLEWALAPNQFGPWGNSSIPEDAILNIEVMQLSGADGQPLRSP